MTRKELATLKHLLSRMRDEHTWTIPGRNGADTYRKRLDAVITDVRELEQRGSFYGMARLEVSPTVPDWKLVFPTPR